MGLRIAEILPRENLNSAISVSVDGGSGRLMHQLGVRVAVRVIVVSYGDAVSVALVIDVSPGGEIVGKLLVHVCDEDINISIWFGN